MLNLERTYTDYNGNERTEIFSFNLNKAELAELQLSEEGGLDKMVRKIVDAKDNKKIMEIFKKLLLKAYGEISPDGKRFIKSEELSIGFSQTEVYSDLFMELAEDADKAADFINGIIPKLPETNK